VTAPGWGVTFSADCPRVNGTGHLCMINCQEPATGHAAVDGGPYDGRFLALVCGRHGSEDGWPEVKAALVSWAETGRLAGDGGPGSSGAPEVQHGDHWDPLPTHEHEHGGR
jgi:hypothetical protein